MRYNIELSEEYVEKLFSLVGYMEEETDDEFAVEDAIKILINEVS